jgi:transcription-repair coupling factor (superfamily II helicase)
MMTLHGIPASAQPLAIAELLGTHHAVLFIAEHDRDMARIEQGIAFFAPQVDIIRFPAWDCLPYDRSSPQASIMAERMLALTRLIEPASNKRIILTSVNAAMQWLPPASDIAKLSAKLSAGQSIKPDALIKLLAAQGYRRSARAMEPGEFAVRGGIMDIVPSGMAEGVRVDWFGDQIESIKRYDLMTQLTQGTVENVALLPASEVQLNESSIELFRTRYRELFGAASREDALYEAVSAGQNYQGMEHWLPLFYKQTQSLFDYAPDAVICYSHSLSGLLSERRETIGDYYEARKEALTTTHKKNSFASGAIYNPLPPDLGFISDLAWQKLMGSRSTIELSPFQTSSRGYKPILPLAQAQTEHTPFDQLREKKGKPILIACYSAGSRERLFGLLSAHDFFCLNIDAWHDHRQVKGKTIGLLILPIENGFESETFMLFSESDVLGERITRAAKKKKNADVFMAEAANFNVGELVVHKEHGIGRFEGLIAVSVQGATHDCLKIMYDGGDRLFLPVENIDIITRYGMEDEAASLDKLGGASWQSRKAKLKERITLAAEALLKLAAERQVRQGAVIETETGSYDEFCARFPYAETEDQERAIQHVLTDLTIGKPMDRLICGDVGFGKTEVALRAAFASVSGKWQVAVIVPTTLLARQHYRNFKTRFEGFPVNVRQLSRMVPLREQQQTREGLKDGSVDIVVGTHALLAKNIEFKRLGLVIVDEEQHFGVAQKEKLKSLKSDVHVLTLSATPIPRTLQMALTGVRDLSLITTPPIDRLAVRSFVLPYDPVVLREALLREKHRGGISYLVCPRIKDMAEIKAQVSELVPELKLAVAHGQMAASELDDIMNDVYDGKVDALLSTAIIESGIDIPTANTMVIFNAHLFGLAQLYQLRGRVGRSKQRAYAYFILPHYRKLTDTATKRLEVMQTLDTLGAGFQLASHDMDIRGFGNLVGEEQSGHIKEVGIELYQQMLEEAVATLKSAVGSSRLTDDKSHLLQTDFSPTINLGLSVLIPETYVEDLSLRMGLYRRASQLADQKEIESFAAELIDRFGQMPEETKHLIDVLGLKVLCKQAGIERIDVGPKGAVLSFYKNTFANPEALLAHIERNPRTLKVRADQKIVFIHEWHETHDKCATIAKLLQSIIALTGNQGKAPN